LDGENKMTGKLNKILLFLILLGITVYGLACSSTRAQNPKTTSTISTDKSDSSTEYKALKRVSKDVITSDKKADKTKQK
jgi:hypothetical protein